ncbi:PREDICTED: centrosomal protein of 162 kDa [Propithecus coquereli]|uniref:centrosomal protein of 162 kDa n=1 Tax=Propithecus coquereli TaxID=379532 RepID=UPI00063F7069|nr:PREDICTED: centrosomal protein of 162 kDa [Propithecus coquereli]
MAHYSKEEMDEEFEQFMKELSDDSFENSNTTPRQTKKEMKKKDAVPWWITEDDFEDGENYSDDFEDEEDIDTPLTTKDEKTHCKGNLKSEKINAPKQVYINYIFDSVSYGQSNSDIEALHQAYCHIAHSLEDAEEQRIESNVMENIKSSVKDHPQENEESSKNISTTESDLPTVEELMKPIKIDSFGVSGFDLQPVSSKKVADSKENEFVSPLPLNMNPNVMSQDPQHVNQFLDKNDQKVILQKTTNEGMENSHPRVPATEEHIDKMYLDILRKKTSVNPSLLIQDDKINKTYRSQLSSGEEGTVVGKQASYKKVRSAPPLLKRKPQSGLYASVRSSGYGKPSSPLNLSTLEKKTSKDVIKSKNLRSIPTSSQARKKDFCIFSKLSSFEETNKKQRWLHFGETTDPVTGEKLKQIQKEIQEQETLLQGYQQENERLYYQVKDLQEQNKKNEERMFKENQSLFSELASLKEQMQKSRSLSQAVEDSEPTRNQSFTDLLTELRVAQKEKNSLLEDIKRLKQDKQALEVDLEKMKKERIEKLKAESGNPSIQQKIRLKDKAVDAKKIQDLERQIQYEQRLEEQEQLLSYKLKEAPQNQRDSSSRVKTLEKELNDIKEGHQITVRNLEAEIDILKHQNAELELKKNNKDDKDFQSIEFQVEQAHAKAKLVRLNEELAAKKREIQDLSKTVERLQKERRMMLSNQNSKGREDMSAKKAKKDVLHPSKVNANSYPGTLDSKLYQPHTFTDSHISEVLQENYRLKNELEGLILERDELKMKSEAAVNQFENSMKRVKEDSAAHIASLKAFHQREVEKLLCQNAVENSSSKIAELNRKIATQEVLIKHFQSQVNELQRKQASLELSEVREEILQKQITKLLEELKKAKENHTPEMKHFMGLEKKIEHMEMRHEQREQELKQIIQQTQQVVETEQNKEIEKWKRLAQLKNREVDKFRTELDSILDVLRELHRQWVVVPVAFADELNAPEY